jgi:ABC-2 type transport system ATP-binding protein
MDAMLEAVSLSKRFGVITALDRVSLRVQRGEVVCLLGANGAGKTTLLHAFLGFVAPDEGHARVGGLEVLAAPLEARRRLGYLPEQVALYGALSGMENLRYFSGLAGRRDASDRELLEALDRMGLAGQDARRRLATYSKGMRQKVGLAVALVKGAGALLLDEPLSGLDPESARDLGNQVRRLASEGTAVLLTTHDLFRAREIASRLAIMRAGRLVATLDAATIDHAGLERIYVEHMGGAMTQPTGWRHDLAAPTGPFLSASS